MSRSGGAGPVRPEQSCRSILFITPAVLGVRGSWNAPPETPFCPFVP